MHQYTPIFRVTPLAGAAYTVALAGYSWVTRAQPLYERIATDHEMLDRSIQQTPYGFRVRVQVDFDFPTPSSNETTLATNLITMAINEDATIEVSLNGGTTYRAALLEEYSQTALADKNIGVRVSTTWVCTDLIETKPAVASGSW